MCAEEGDSFPDHDPACIGDKETKSASRMAEAGGRIAWGLFFLGPVTDALHAASQLRGAVTLLSRVGEQRELRRCQPVYQRALKQTSATVPPLFLEEVGVCERPPPVLRSVLTEPSAVTAEWRWSRTRLENSVLYNTAGITKGTL